MRGQDHFHSIQPREVFTSILLQRLAFMATKYIFAGVLIFSLVLQVVKAQEQHSSFLSSFRVQVNVTAEAALKTQLISYLSRALRSLDDIIVTDLNPDYMVSVVALELNVKGREDSSGFAFSTLISVPSWSYADREYMREGLPDKDYEQLEEAADYFELEDYERVIGHYLQIYSFDELRDYVEDIVVKLDGDYLEPVRLSRERMRESLREWRRKNETLP